MVGRPRRDGRGSTLEAWEVLSSRDVFRADPWVRLSVHHIRFPSGAEIRDYYQVHLREYVIVVGSTRSGRFILERQYRPAVNGRTLIWPSGFLEKGESPLEAARRELLEETGFGGGRWQRIGSFVLDGHRGLGCAHIFRATGIRRKSEVNSDPMESSELVFMPAGQVRRAIRKGDLSLLPAVFAFTMAALGWRQQGVRR